MTTFGEHQQRRQGNSCLKYTFFASIAAIIIAYFVLQPRDSSAPSSPHPTEEATKTAEKYSSPLAKVYAGVKIYYGGGEEKTYAFEILGGSSDCPSMPSGKGLKVKYPDGTTGWKDRDSIVSSGTFYVLSDDPAIKKLEWNEYKLCP